jgi:hypothetical protein
MHFRNRLRATPAEKQHILENIDPQSRPSHKSRYAIPRSPVFHAWRQSRRTDRSSEPLPAGSQRPVTLSNIFAATVIIRACMVDLFVLLFNLHPTRTLLLFVFNILRGTLPSVRGYSQARILDEVCHFSQIGSVLPLTEHPPGAKFVLIRQVKTLPRGILRILTMPRRPSFPPFPVQI